MGNLIATSLADDNIRFETDDFELLFRREVIQAIRQLQLRQDTANETLPEAELAAGPEPIVLPPAEEPIDVSDFLLAVNNLSDVSSAFDSRANLGLGLNDAVEHGSLTLNGSAGTPVMLVEGLTQFTGISGADVFFLNPSMTSRVEIGVTPANGPRVIIDSQDTRGGILLNYDNGGRFNALGGTFGASVDIDGVINVSPIDSQTTFLVQEFYSETEAHGLNPSIVDTVTIGSASGGGGITLAAEFDIEESRMRLYRGNISISVERGGFTSYATLRNDPNSLGVFQIRVNDASNTSEAPLSILSSICTVDCSAFLLENTSLGFFSDGPAARQTVTGNISDGTALTSLLTALQNYGLITDNTTA